MNTQTFSPQAQKEIDMHSSISDRQYVSFAYETKNSEIISILANYLNVTNVPKSALMVSSNVEDNDENITTHLFTYFLVDEKYTFVGDVEKFMRSKLNSYMTKATC